MSSGPRNQQQSPSKSGPASQAFPLKKILVLKLKTASDQKVYKLHKERIVIGSVVSADVRVTGEGVSPIHAVMELSLDSKTGTYFGTIFDLASDTGVFVNDKKVIAQRLNDQDEIIIGRYRFKFSLEDLSSQKEERTRETEGRTLFLNKKEDLAPLLLQDERDVIEIFDFRPTSKRALEVVMSWHGTILDVEHFIKEKSVTLGATPKSDFAIPPILSSTDYPIVTQSGGGFVLHLDAKMRGVMHQSGSLKSLDEIRGNTVKGSNGFEVSIGDQDFAKISIADIDFYFCFTAAPPRLKRRRIFERDAYFLKVFSSSMVLSALVMAGLFKMKPPKSIEAEQVPERIATILYDEKTLTPPPVTPKPVPKPTPAPTPAPPPPKKPPEEKPPEPKPVPPKKQVVQMKAPPKPPEEKKPLPKVMDVAPEVKPEVKKDAKPNPPPAAKPAAKPNPAPKAEAKEGEGARAKGKEGSRGEPDKKKTNMKVTELSRPSPNAGNKGASGASQVSDEGNVDILKGAGGKIQNILGNSAAHLGDGSENLKGFGNFATGGNGGLALSGSGQGGGGDAETTLGGLGKKGNGMGRVGTGKGAAGNGNGIVGANVRVAIRTDGPEEAVVMGAIDRNAVAEAIYAHKDEFRLCYEREINAEHPSMAGQIGTSFVIGASGRVNQAGVESSSLNNPATERCVIQVLKRIQFPMPRGGGVVEVHFPFKFSTAK